MTNTFNNANQLTGNGTDTFDYDNNGNLWKTNSVVSHTWDRANRLLSHGGLDYAYDGLGNQISQDNGMDVTSYLLDLQSGLPKVLSETVGSNVTCFVHSPIGLHATENNAGSWFWSLQDGLGIQRGEVNASGAIGASQDFTPYGVVQNVTGTFNSPYAFTGEPVDANGLQYHRARYYDPAMGVWTSLDPLETDNRYAYGNSNPVMNIDSTGLSPSLECCISSCETYKNPPYRTQLYSDCIQNCIDEATTGFTTPTCPEFPYIVREGNQCLHYETREPQPPTFIENLAWQWYDGWQELYVNSEWSKTVRGNPADAAKTIVYASASVVLILATGGTAIVPMAIGAGATVVQDLVFDAVGGDPITLSDMEFSAPLSNAFWSGLTASALTRMGTPKLETFNAKGTLWKGVGKTEQFATSQVQIIPPIQNSRLGIGLIGSVASTSKVIIDRMIGDLGNQLLGNLPGVTPSELPSNPIGDILNSYGGVTQGISTLNGDELAKTIATEALNILIGGVAGG